MRTPCFKVFPVTGSEMVRKDMNLPLSSVQIKEKSIKRETKEKKLQRKH